MIYNDVQSFLISIGKEGRILAMDYGKKKIGTAISDQMRIISSPFKLIDHKNIAQRIQAIVKIIDTEDVVGVVVGLPIEMSGYYGEIAHDAKRFADKLSGMINIDILLYDERCTSTMSSYALGGLGLSYQKKNKYNDCIASSIVLSDILNMNSSK